MTRSTSRLDRRARAATETGVEAGSSRHYEPGRNATEMGSGAGSPGGYESAVWHASREAANVRFRVRRMSLARRHRLLLELRRLEAERAFHEAGESAAAAAEIESELREMAIRAGLLAIEGLVIDGAPATVESLIARGPESLAAEIAEAVAAESALSETERKN